MHPLMNPNWRHIWKHTVEKSQTYATNATMHCLRQTLWGHILKDTVEKNQTNAASVTLPALIQVLWGDIWKCTAEKSKKMQSMWLCILTCMSFKDTFEITQWKKSNKCNQCDFASSYKSAMRIHLKTHNGEKSYNCNQCNYASSQAGHLRTHLKNTIWKIQTNATNVIMPLLRQAIWGHI